MIRVIIHYDDGGSPMEFNDVDSVTFELGGALLRIEREVGKDKQDRTTVIPMARVCRVDYGDVSEAPAAAVGFTVGVTE